MVSQETKGSAREAERDVRLLLHRVRKPEELAANPLAQALCNALGFSDPAIAVRKVVEETFAAETPEDVSLRNLIIKCDVEGTLSLKQACEQFAYSRRHFQRYRAQAIAAIARHIALLFDPSSSDAPALQPLEGLAEVVSDHDPKAAAQIYALERANIQAKGELRYLRSRVRAGEELDENDARAYTKVPEQLALAIAAQSQEISGNPTRVSELVARLHDTIAEAQTAFDAITCYELEWLRFLQASHRSDAFSLESSARSLNRLSRDYPSLRLRTLIATGFAAITAGDTASAQEAMRTGALIAYQERSVSRLATITLLQAQSELLRGKSENAERLAMGAGHALGASHFVSFSTQFIVGRARLLAGKAWRPPDLDGCSQSSWYRLSLELLDARHQLAQGDPQKAEQHSRAGLHLAKAMGYAGLCAYAAATLMGCALVNGDAYEAQRLRVTAFSEFTKTGDHLLSYDLFYIPGQPPIEIDDLLVDVLMQRVDLIIPQSSNDTPEQRTATRKVIAALCRYADRTSNDLALLDEVAAGVNESNSAFAHYLEKTAAQLRSMLSLNVSTLVAAPERPHVARRVSDALGRLVTSIRPGERRLFLVG